METYEEEKAYLIKNMDVVFMQESYADERIISQQKKIGIGSFKHQLKNQNGDILALAECS
jgi:hypothetical protein